MFKNRIYRMTKLIAAGALILQAPACMTNPMVGTGVVGVLDFLQTAFLAVTAAGSYAILRNL